MTILDRLNDFCSPESKFWWKNEAESCQFNDHNEFTVRNSTTCHDGVDLPLCFEDTAILYGICAVFLVVAGFLFVCGNSQRPRLPFGLLHAFKLIFLLVPAITAICDLIYTIVKGRTESVAQYQYVTPVVIIVTMVMCALVIHRDRLRGHRSSGLMLLFWLGLVIYGSLKLRTYILIARDQLGVTDKFRFSTFCLQYIVYLLQLILSVIPEPRRVTGYQLISGERRPCPEEDASFLSRITWWWQNKQIWDGWRHPLEYDDLADLNTVDQSRVVAPRFQRNWDKELRKAKITFDSRERKEPDDGGFVNDVYSVQFPSHEVQPRREERESTCRQRRSEPSLILALAKSFAGTFLAAAFFKLCQDLLGFVSPQLLKLMISFTKHESDPDWHGYVYAALLFLTAVVQSLFLHQYFHRCFIVGMRIRTAIIVAVYNKALRLSNKARRTSTVGEIVNLMSVDAQRLMDLTSYLNMLWSAPLQIVLSLVFLYLAMGPSIFAGFAIMILMIPVNAILATWSRKLQVKQMILKDSRIKLVNELLNGIKVIKLYAWEIPFQRLVFGIRQQELNQLKKNAYLNASSSFTWTCAPFLVSLGTFVTYALVNRNNPEEQLTADKAFVALSLFNILRFPLSLLPMLISNMVQASVSVKRLRSFLENEELDPDVVDWSMEPPASEAPVLVSGGQFSWDDERPTLSNVNLRVKPGQLVAVVGQVGAGKSSLIQALLGEMEKHGGNVSLKGSVAYVPQQAWIQNATLKENILFGKELKNMRYGKTLESCALGPDLDMLPGRDMVEIGEKGINLSGGQKQRVSLARAVYQDSDIYLLDDPLSAVDSHVGKHIFDKVIGPKGILKDKVRILVTHGIGFLPQCDVIVVMADGQITEVGSYTELIDNDGDFAQFLQTYQNVESNEDKNEPLEKIELQRQSSRSSMKLMKQSSRTSLYRQQSTQSIGSNADIPDNDPTELTPLITEEKAETGKVKFSVILAYCRACTWSLSILTLLFYTLTSGASVASNFWLADWSNANGNLLLANKTSNGTTFKKVTACDKEDGPDVGCYLGIYSGLGAAQALLVFFGAFSLALAAIFASRSLHSKMLKNILRSPMSFFDTTPLGRVLNRFSKDIYVIDEVIPRSARTFLFTFFSVLSSLVVIVVTTPTFIIAIIPLGIFYFLVQRFYVATSRQLKRLESITRSPIYSHFQESLLGASSIRAYRQQDRFMKESERRVDYNQIAYYPNICANRWLAIRLEFVGNLIILFAALFAVIQRNYGEELHLNINPGLVGLSITYALQITQSLNMVVRMASELETNIVAVERINEYSETPTEAPPIIESHRPPDDWPPEGHVKFDHYSTRYREGLDLVLKDIAVDIPGGTKVGIVGRTGAGKSSLTLSMFRIIEAAGGAILIDNTNITDFGLDDLRSKITIIPQDPVLFSGTLRMNIDPFESYSDGDLWRALESAHLKAFVSGLEEKLLYPIAEGGENLSVGQRQLVCLARALLRKTKILVLDEATAAVDLETDDLIQKTIRSEFRECTVITIAHRLNTIMDYDRIVVLDNGRVREYDAPNRLLADRKSVFFSMATDAGLTT